MVSSIQMYRCVLLALLPSSAMVFAAKQMELDQDSSALANFFEKEREVKLKLVERQGVETSLVSLYSTWTKSDKESHVVELLKVPTKKLDDESLNLLNGGGDLTATVGPTNEFFIAGNSDPFIGNPTEASRQLLAPVAPTLCGNVRARSMLSLRVKGKTISTKASYYFVKENNSFSRKLQQDFDDPCDIHDKNFGACTDTGEGAECLQRVTRRKKWKKQTVCKSKCSLTVDGKQVKGELSRHVEDTESMELEEMFFDGHCKSYVVPGASPDQCLCDLTADEKKKRKEFLNNPRPAPASCTGDACGTASGGGDPHFYTWDGLKYSYHGECDLVLTKIPDFGNGLGLDLHARTEIKDKFSYISNSALRIGTDVLEVLSNGTHYVNGVLDAELPTDLSGHPVTKAKRTQCGLKGPSAGSKPCTDVTVYRIELGDGESIEMRNRNGFLFSNLKGGKKYTGSVGLLGTWNKPGMIARDGETFLEEANNFGAEWQVRSDEPMLFYRRRAPQYPQACILPRDKSTTASRRLRENHSQKRSLAEAACAHIQDKTMKEFCTFDIMETGDFVMADDPFYSHHDEDDSE